MKAVANGKISVFLLQSSIIINFKNLTSFNLIRLNLKKEGNFGKGANGMRFERSDWYSAKLNT